MQNFILDLTTSFLDIAKNSSYAIFWRNACSQRYVEQSASLFPSVEGVNAFTD